MTVELFYLSSSLAIDKVSDSYTPGYLPISAQLAIKAKRWSNRREVSVQNGRRGTSIRLLPTGNVVQAVGNTRGAPFQCYPRITQQPAARQEEKRAKVRQTWWSIRTRRKKERENDRYDNTTDNRSLSNRFKCRWTVRSSYSPMKHKCLESKWDYNATYNDIYSGFFINLMHRIPPRCNIVRYTLKPTSS